MTRKEKLWSKHWISEGIRTIHESHLEDNEPLVMTVDHLVRRGIQIKGEDGIHEKRRMVVGVLCHWFDKDQNYQQGRFNTNEIFPAEIVKESKLESWLEETNGKEIL